MSAAPRFVQRALAGHAAIGLLSAALLYIITLTGSIAVIHDRWQQWEEPNVPATSRLSPEAVQAALVASIASAKAPQSQIYIRLPTDGFARATVTTDSGTRYVDQDGRLGPVAAPSWTETIIALHEYLELPAAIGLILVGAMGVVLAAVSITGILAHPRILRDAFRLRTRHDPQIARADWHNRLGTWTLPFALAIALTGAFLGLSTLGAAVLARANTGGDIMRVYAPIFGALPTPDPAPAPAPDAAAALRTLAGRTSGVTPTYVFVVAPGTRGQQIQITAGHPRRLIYGESYRFDAAGRWLGAIGLADGSLGQQAAASTYNLHFGNFGGVAVEVAYMALGIALCAIIATGVTLWLRKRQRRGSNSARLVACWKIVVWGSPALLVWLLWVRALIGAEAPLGTIFWAALAIGTALSLARPNLMAFFAWRPALATSIAITAIVHAAALAQGANEARWIDGGALSLAVLIAGVGRTDWRAMLRR